MEVRQEADMVEDHQDTDGSRLEATTDGKRRQSVIGSIYYI